MVILCVHLSGCLWIIVAQLNDYDPDTWVTRVGMVDSANLDIYIAAIYWSIQTLLTVGYGDIPAVTTGKSFLIDNYFYRGDGCCRMVDDPWRNVLYVRY